MPEIIVWVQSQRRDRGICQDCGQQQAATFWGSDDGPWICWDCCEKRRADYDCCEHCAAAPCITAPHATSCQHGCNDEADADA